MIVVDLAAVGEPVTYRASGSLWGISTTEPPDALVGPTKPRLFRQPAGTRVPGFGAVEVYPRARSFGARVQSVLADAISYTFAEPTENGNADSDGSWSDFAHEFAKRDWSAWEGIFRTGDWSRWEKVVREEVQRTLAAGIRDMQWDIWNEPDQEDSFWRMGRDRFFDLWLRTFGMIRDLDPRAEIVGPSLSTFDLGWLTAFLASAHANHVVPDVISWHEWEPAGDIRAHIEQLKQAMVEHGIPVVERYSINEYHHLRQETEPGTAVHFLANLERAGVESAARGLWSNRGSLGNLQILLHYGDCPAGAAESAAADSLGNARESPVQASGSALRSFLHYSSYSYNARSSIVCGSLPRSVWWVYSAYGSMGGRLAQVTPHDSTDGLAAVDPERGLAHVLIGHADETEAEVALRVTGLGQASYLRRTGLIHLAAERIPNSGDEPLRSPVPVADAARAVTGDTLDIQLPAFGARDAYLVTLSAPGG